jgi:hypothetical protein
LTRLSDNQIGDLIEEGRRLFENQAGETLRGETTLKAVRLALVSLQAGLVLAEAQDMDLNPVVIDPKKLDSAPK